jgi:hypothetical protein
MTTKKTSHGEYGLKPTIRTAVTLDCRNHRIQCHSRIGIYIASPHAYKFRTKQSNQTLLHYK